MTRWLTSDLHFGHRLMLRLFREGHGSVQDMDEDIVERLNAAIQPGDEVYHLGDLSYHRSERTAALLRRLHGRWTLLRGNHDSWGRLPRDWRHSGWVDGPYLELEGAVLCHYPIECWNGRFRGVRHFHGHTHRPTPNPSIPGRLCVAWDSWGRPLAWDEAVALAGEPSREQFPAARLP